MTVIVGFLSDKKMYIGGDRFGSNGHNGKVVNRPKVFKKGSMLLGYTGSFRFGQIVEKHFDLPEDTRKDPYDYMILDFVPAIRKVLEDNKYVKVDEQYGAEPMICCYRGLIYKFQSGWSVLEYTDYKAVGSGAESAEGAMSAIIDLDLKPKDKVYRALRSASDNIVSVSDPFDIISLPIDSGGD